MEGALLERQQRRLLRIAPRPLGEDEDGLAVLAHLARGALESLYGLGPVDAVNEDGAAEGHEPAEEGDRAERGLGRHGGVGGKAGAEEEDVELGLVVPNDYDGALGFEELFVRGRHDEANSGGIAHSEGEGARGGVLGEAVVAEGSEGERGEDAIAGAGEEGGVGGQAARREGYKVWLTRYEVCEGEEEEGKGHVGDREDYKGVEEGVHREEACSGTGREWPWR